MDKTFNPEKYKLMVCPLCKGSGKLKRHDGLSVCKRCGGFGFIKKEKGTLEEDKNES